MVITDLMFGGITGLVGGIAQKVADYKTKKIELEMLQKKTEAEIALREVDAKVMAQEWAARTQVAELEGDAQMRVASYGTEPKMYSDPSKLNSHQEWLMVLVDFLRGFVRPALTLYLCGITTLMYLRTDGASIDPKAVVDTLLYLTTVAVTWWYGSRSGKQK